MRAMDSIERRVRNAVASTGTEGITLSDHQIAAMYRIARGELNAADHIRKMGLVPKHDLR
ncbi:antitoxin VbhA family protein [Corynebacterium pseudodiphtheriticum]|nr:antitoxin VbhA family protein [Corynebacterium pseudodiphtheriticum]MDK8578892.1 antitoxin VbhA family protein [Corynebacterium pseudodiphtheriticum]MDK8701197.1 antitoxin VbhA family protein [Corynebacterium pseudodiphtheriticum]MDK8775849.1 antitoxin VbhA family protein [Corynebacterium pseudodiphtheriticum]